MLAFGVVHACDREIDESSRIPLDFYRNRFGGSDQEHNAISSVQVDVQKHRSVEVRRLQKEEGGQKSPACSGVKSDRLLLTDAGSHHRGGVVG